MNSTPPKISSLNIWFAAIAVAVMAAGIAGMVFFFNPAAYSFYPVCLFHRLTGLNCPGCGGTRALYALLHGHFAAALRDNALLVGGEKNPRAGKLRIFPAQISSAAAGHHAGVRRAAEFAGVRVSFAVKFGFYAGAAWCSISGL